MLLSEKWVAELKNIEVAGDQVARDFVVQRVGGVMAFLEKAPDREAELLGVGLRAERLRGERDDHQTRQQRKRATKEFIHKDGQKGSQNSI